MLPGHLIAEMSEATFSRHLFHNGIHNTVFARDFRLHCRADELIRPHCHHETCHSRVNPTIAPLGKSQS